MRVTVSPHLVASLISHLADQGFPAKHAGGGTLDVLFPGSPAIFPAAAELDLWAIAGDDDRQLVVLEEVPRR